MLNQELADLLFPNVHLTPAALDLKYPRRKLEPSMMVTRFAPSPTGFLHIGGLYTAFISERLAHQSGGVFYLRIEDTDNKREIKGSVQDIIRSLSYFGIYFNEGVTPEEEEIGHYGPYKQSSRKEIYSVYLKHLIQEGHAYPCFCREEELHAIRTLQQERKITTGYYGEWARHRNMTLGQVKDEMASGKSFVIATSRQVLLKGGFNTRI